MATGAVGGAYADPYATPKANLRDAIKWLASIFAALAAVVIAGTPISNLSAASLTLVQKVLGVVALLVAFGGISGAVVLMLRLLRTDAVYLTDIDPRHALAPGGDTVEVQGLRADIAARKEHFFPDYASLEDFFARADAASANADLLARAWQEAVATRARARAVAAAKADYDTQVQAIAAFDAAKQDMLAYAAYLRFYGRVRRAAWPLLGLGTLALVALLVFTLAVQPPKDDKGPTVVVIPLPPPIPASAPAGAVHAGTVIFATGRAEVRAEGRAVVQAVRDGALARPEVAVLVVARTDTVGSPAANLRLARDRATAVRGLLVQPGGLGASRVFVAEVPKSDLPRITGDQEPVGDNRSVSMYFVPFRREP